MKKKRDAAHPKHTGRQSVAAELAGKLGQALPRSYTQELAVHASKQCHLPYLSMCFSVTPRKPKWLKNLQEKSTECQKEKSEYVASFALFVCRVNEALSGQGVQLGQPDSQALEEWMESRGQRATWDRLERSDPRVNKEIQDRRACPVLRVPSDCQERRVPREKEACWGSLVSTARRVTLEERAPPERKACKAYWELRGLLATRDHAG